MRILFHITGYRDPGQFYWLYRAIYNKHDIFVIHIDKKTSPEVHYGFRSITYGHQNTHFIKSLPVIWGGTGLIQAELEAIRFALKLDQDWYYLINLSAQDYPLISVDQLRKRLEEAWPNNFVQCKALSTVHWRIRKRLWFRHIEHHNKRHFTPIPKMPNRELRLDWYGAWWHILSRDFCAWWSSTSKAHAYLRGLQSAGMPDEFLIQNAIQDSPFRDVVVPESKHEIVWCNPGDPLSVTAHPNILTMNDQDVLTRSKAFFARKFDRTVDQAILALLAQRIGAPPAYRDH